MCYTKIDKVSLKSFEGCKTKKKKTDRLRKAILQTPITNQECKRNNCIYFSLHHTVGKHEFPLPINYPKPSTTCGQNCVCVESLESLLCNVYTLDKKQLSHHDPCKHQNSLLQSGCTLFLLGDYQFVPWPSLDRHLFSADQRNLGYPDLVAQFPSLHWKKQKRLTFLHNMIKSIKLHHTERYMYMLWLLPPPTDAHDGMMRMTAKCVR